MILSPGLAARVALGMLLLPTAALAGLNPSATARMYWLEGNTVASTSQNSTAATVKLLVTIKGVSSFRGGDVQLYVSGLDAGLPDAWRVDPAGCNYSNYTVRQGGFNGACAAIFPSIWSACAAPLQQAVTGVQTSQPGAMRFNDPITCLTPHGLGFIWFSSAGAAGELRDPSKEYGFLGLELDLSGSEVSCAGDLASGDPQGTCVAPNYHVPCSVPRGAVLAVVDAEAHLDYASFDSGHFPLVWHATPLGPWNGGSCFSVLPVGSRSWGELRRLYH